MRLILCGDADIMITGGTEASITPLTIAGFANMRALSQFNSDPPKAADLSIMIETDLFWVKDQECLLLKRKHMQKIEVRNISRTCRIRS